MDYKQSGVDVEAGYKAVELMKEHVKTTHNDGVVNDIGGFGGLYSLAKYSMEEPILVSGTDGVGTKLKVAFELDKHDTIGIDCVAMCVNDIICAGAEPLFFLDYIACGKNYPEKIANIVSGVAEGCRQSGAALIGGETAEMPGFYPENEYDMADFQLESSTSPRSSTDQNWLRAMCWSDYRHQVSTATVIPWSENCLNLQGKNCRLKSKVLVPRWEMRCSNRQKYM